LSFHSIVFINGGSWTEENFVFCFFILFKLLDKSINLIELNHYWNVFHYILLFEQWVYFVGKGKKVWDFQFTESHQLMYPKMKKPWQQPYMHSQVLVIPQIAKKVAGYHLRPGILKVSIMCFSPRQRMWTILRDISPLPSSNTKNSIGKTISKEVTDSYRDIEEHFSLLDTRWTRNIQ
jgi:hypothetical protein